jgi:hypothetical protein
LKEEALVHTLLGVSRLVGVLGAEGRDEERVGGARHDDVSVGLNKLPGFEVAAEGDV